MLDTATAPPAEQDYELGVSRPPLQVADLPEPEEVFGVPRLGASQIIRFVIGPSLIALGISIGSGEWLLGPLNIGTFGFVGLGWVITVSAVLQTFYNVEISRYVVATGEVPVVGFARTPPGLALWIPLALIVLFAAFITGGWAAAAGQGLYALITGEIPGPDDRQTVRFLAIGLLVVVFAIAALARKISRALELTNWVLVGGILIILIVVDLLIVPFDLWWEGIRGFFTPAKPPEGITATQLGALAGFTALASGLNWYVMAHYRDKGYGMGTRVGHIAGMRGERRDIAPVGATFPDDPANNERWRRWFRLLKIDMWGVFFVGAMVGMLLPTILMAQTVELTGETPTADNVPTFVAEALRVEYGEFAFYTALLVGVMILFSTQLGIFEALVRNFTDALHAVSPRLRQRIEGGDPRRFYFGFMILLIVVISIVLHLALPVTLVSWSANMSNLGALIFPFVLIYLNRRLPAVARPKWFHYVFLILNFLFFGFFFINFAFEQITGDALFSF
jgi:hypothetical protein